jgi:type I restriction enzyme, S subunit
MKSSLLSKPNYKFVHFLFGKDIEIPKEWNIQNFRNFVSLQHGFAFDSKDFTKHEGIDVIKIKNIQYNGVVNIENSDKVQLKNIKNMENFSIKRGDILMALTGATLGKTGMVTSSKNLLQNQRVGKLFPKNNQILDNQFLFFILRSYTIQKQLWMLVTALAQPNIGKPELDKIKFILPSFSEQQKIVSILSHIDNLTNIYDEIILQTKSIKQGLMEQLLTKGIGHKKFKKIKWLFGNELEIPKEWEIKSLDILSQKILDGEHISPEFTNSGIPYLSSRHIKSKILFHDCKYVSNETFSNIIQRIHPEYDDVLITVKGTIGFCKRLDIREKFCMDRNVGLIKPLKKIINSVFLEQIMKSSIVQKQILGLTDNNVIPSLYLNQIKKIKIFLPSANEQQKIVSVLSKIDFKINDLESKKSYLETLKKGLMQNLLTGQIRVKIE